MVGLLPVFKGTAISRTLAQRLESKGVTRMTWVLDFRDQDLCFALRFEVADRFLVGLQHGVGGLKLGEGTGDKYLGVSL